MNAPSGPHLVYVADPMCSWCWGFAPVIAAIRARFADALPVRVLMGGLRPGTDKPMDAAAKADVRGHWQHVHEASGQPFDFAFFERDGFVYDTDPAARAVVVARRGGQDAGLECLSRIQEAFYAGNRDVTDAAVLAELAAPAGAARDAFLEAFHGEEAKQETWRDYGIAQRSGVAGFPTLLAGDGAGNRYAAVTRGYQPAERLLPVLERWLG
ncbi:DsbA family protein [Azospirillum sp. ST 5-10]|uniref:DsbA family protein n=1 Tax=unclassified Azospirillum TaxID=2630922 RepID=UPI003F4A206D